MCFSHAPWSASNDNKTHLYLFLNFFTGEKFSISESDNEIKEAERLDKVLQPVHHSMFVESNPSPVKYAAKLMNLCEDEVRLPLVKVTEETKIIVKKAIESAKLIWWTRKPIMV